MADADLRRLKRAADAGGLEERKAYAAAMTRAGRCWLCAGNAESEPGSLLPPCCHVSDACYGRATMRWATSRDPSVANRSMANFTLCAECPHGPEVFRVGGHQPDHVS